MGNGHVLHFHGHKHYCHLIDCRTNLVSNAIALIFPFVELYIRWLVRPTQYVSKGFDRRYLRIILLVIESGAVITAGKLSEFILFKLDPPTPTGNHPMYIVFDMMPQITVRFSCPRFPTN